MFNVYLFQPQFTNFVNGKINNWLPYSAGALWAYASQFKDITDNFILKDLIFKRENIDLLVDRIDNPKICGFSCYLWNKNYCLAVAEKIKNRWPDCVIVFGGPEVNSKILKHSFISTIVLGEGEQNFVDILRNVIANKPPAEFLPKTRMESLEMPSPYLTGIFDDIIQKNPEVMWAMTLETNRGCPYSCSFCDWGSLTYSKVKRFEIDKVEEEINWIKNNPISYLYVADANFGLYKDRDLKISQLIKLATENSSVEAIVVQSAKQSTEVVFEIGKALGEKYAGVDIAMQSMNPATLEAVHRKNLDINNIKELLELSYKYQVPTYTEMILGLPYETFDSWCIGLTDLLELGQHNTIEMWFTSLLENSELSQSANRIKYKIKSIVSKNYINLKKVSDWDDPDEYTEIICATSTMTTDEMIEAYMFGWIIVQIHGNGYSQILTRYLNSCYKISFLELYQYIFNNLSKLDYFKEHFNYVKRLVTDFLKTGNVSPEANGHMLHSVSAPWLYDRRIEVMNQLYNLLKIKYNIPDWVFNLQLGFIYDEESRHDKKVLGDYDIINNKPLITEYSLSSKIKEVNSLTTALVRRRGLIKNFISVNSETARVQ